VEDGRVVIGVTDHGIGIAACDWAHIFDRYFRRSTVGLPGRVWACTASAGGSSCMGRRSIAPGKEGSGSRRTLPLPAPARGAAGRRRPPLGSRLPESIDSRADRAVGPSG
jgi:hypothetical protein